jgi:two-component system, OmpR family, alkaline phosphatase synthesis response regulator PhoP
MPKTILIVDDETNIARLVEMNLVRAGYEVAKAVDGREGLEAASNLRPDLILLDVTMPQMDGFEMLRLLKGDAALQHIPVIMVTARAQDADILRGKEGGALHYLTKPINPLEMLSLIERVFKEQGPTTDESEGTDEQADTDRR